jgi:hypothetical protein
MMKVDKLNALIDEAIHRKDLDADPLPGGKFQTKCNFGLQAIARGMGCKELEGMRANEIIAHAAMGANWRVDTWERAVLHALEGRFAFMGWSNPAAGASGHVATVAPLEMVKSATWDMLVPWLANVGMPPNAVKMASGCFLKAHKDALRCFLWVKE